VDKFSYFFILFHFIVFQMKKHIYVLVPKQPPGQELSLTIKKRKSDSPDEEASASKCVKVEEQLPDQVWYYMNKFKSL